MAGFGRSSKIIGALAAAFLLSAAQVLPTFRLARLASPRRDFEYLSGFAVSPLHLVTFVAPGLMERSPLWRPLVWAPPFHTSPEEYLGYVGLVPLFLALGAVVWTFRRSAATRALAVVGLATLVLAMGPYAPGFRWLITLPGFSFFRAPARWTLATSLALALLAGIGFDALRDRPRLVRSVLMFCTIGFVWISAVVVFVEAAAGHFGEGPPTTWCSYALDRLPWGETHVRNKIEQAARRPFRDQRVEESWARDGVVLRDAPRPVFAELHCAIYREELLGTAAGFAGMIALAVLARRPERVRVGFVVLTLIDLGMLGRHRRVDLGPIQPLETQSPVLARLAASPDWLRSVDSTRNLPMVVGVGPVSAYRTLDLPALESLTALAGRTPRTAAEASDVAEALRLTGADVRVYDPFEAAEADRLGQGRPGVGDVVRVRDPNLVGWRLGADWVVQQSEGAKVYEVGWTRVGSSRAWLVEDTPDRSRAILGDWSGDPHEVMRTVRGAIGLSLRRSAPRSLEPSVHSMRRGWSSRTPNEVYHTVRRAIFSEAGRPDPEHLELDVRVTGPSYIIVSELADPQWEAVWVGQGQRWPVTIHRAFGKPGQGAWMAIKTPGPGPWRLQLIYQARDVETGLAVTATAFSVWLVFEGRGRSRRRRLLGTTALRKT